MIKLFKLFFQVLKSAMDPNNIEEKMELAKKYNQIQKQKINEEYEKLKKE